MEEASLEDLMAALQDVQDVKPAVSTAEIYMSNAYAESILKCSIKTLI